MPDLRLCVPVAVLCAGCATAVESPRGAVPRAGAVGVQDISGLTAAPHGRIALAGNESYLEPLEAVDSPLPAYPAHLLAARLDAQAVCVRIGIDATGAIVSSRPHVESPACPAAADPAFAQAAADTLATWTFEPARRCIFPTPEAKELALASCSGGREVPIAVSLTYRFVFEQRDGEGSVRMGR